MRDLPDSIGKYQVKSSLGEGAMGVVYEGFDPDIERRVAIKILHPHLIEDKNGEAFLERFRREAKSAARCIHPNIVTILEYGQDGEMPYIVMEFVDGESLQQIIGRKRPIALRNTLSIVSQLLRALHAAHRMQIVHRDIKAANVMVLRGSSNVKLADFGIARLGDNPGLTMTGAVVGTPKYMAPEQMFGLEVDARADLFAVAMVFLELLGYCPATEVAAKSSLPPIANLPPNNQIDYGALYPTALIPVLQRGLAVDQEQRFQTAREFMQAIKAALPNLKAGRAAPSEEATDVAHPAAAPRPVTAPDAGRYGDLDSITDLLTDYVGPIARNIVATHRGSHTSIEELATMISREIPSVEEREAFLRTWHTKSGHHAGSGRETAPASDPGRLESQPGVSALDDELLERISIHYTDFVGPIASRLVRYHSAGVTELEQLVDSLAREIPNGDDSNRFREYWLRHGHLG